VKRLRFDPIHEITHHGSRGFTIGGVVSCRESRISLARLDADGVIGEHPTVSRQLLLVVEGEAQTGGETLRAGDGVLWEDGEQHETRSAEGCTALLIEGELELL
jgi:Quercetinase C-terminal cupin domain